jgi:hypothetical protein
MSDLETSQGHLQLSVGLPDHACPLDEQVAVPISRMAVNASITLGMVPRSVATRPSHSVCGVLDTSYNMQIGNPTEA